MSGQDGNRGYLIQTVIALLESLDLAEWNEITIEPAYDQDKVDIEWRSESTSKAYQVKSSINQLNLPDVIKWAEELENNSSSDELTLILIGPCSKSVARLKNHKKVAVPTPKNLDFNNMIGLSAHLLDKFLRSEGLSLDCPIDREVMSRALVTQLSIFASEGTPIKRGEFIELLKNWIKRQSPETLSLKPTDRMFDKDRYINSEYEKLKSSNDRFTMLLANH